MVSFAIPSEEKLTSTKVRGIVFFEFIKYGESYWPCSSTIVFRNGSAKSFFSSPATIDTYKYYCYNDWKAQFHATSDFGDPIFSCPLFQDQDSSQVKNDVHQGGEIYYKSEYGVLDTARVIIAFEIWGTATELKDICQGFKEEFSQKDDCPVKCEDLTGSVMVLSALKRFRPLGKEVQARLNLVKSRTNHFIVSYCE